MSCRTGSARKRARPWPYLRPRQWPHRSPHELGLRDGSTLFLRLNQQEPANIDLSVEDHVGAPMLVCKIKISTRLQKIYSTVCHHWQISRNDLQLLFNDQVINPEQAPQDLGMEDGDVIEARFVRRRHALATLA